MRTSYRSRIILLFLTLVSLFPTVRSQELPLSLGEINSRSETVVRARAESTESRWTSESGNRNIVTTTTFRVLESIRGDLAVNSLFSIQLLGGRVGDIVQQVTSSVAFDKGQESYLFLNDGGKHITGGEQGRIPVVNGRIYLQDRPVETRIFSDALRRAQDNPSAPDSLARSLQVESRRITPKPVGANRLKSGNSTTDTWAIYGRKAAFTGEVDNDSDGYFETFSFQIQVNGDAVPGPSTVYFQITCTTTGQVWQSTNSFEITGTAEDYYNFAFDQSDFAGKINGNTELAFTVDLLDQAKSTVLATDSNIGGDAIKVDEPTTTNVTLSAISPDRASAGTASTVTLTGSGFGASQGNGKVEFFYRSGQPKIEAPVISWSDTQIICTVPIGTIDSYPASAGSGPVTVTTNSGITSNGVTFRVTFSAGGPRWATGTVAYRINENLATVSGEGQSIQNAANSWNAAGANFHYQYDGTHSNTSTSYDGANEILWAPLSSSTTIGQASIWYSGGYITECDIAFNSNLSWNSGSSSVDIETIALHELGHWLNLRDIYGSVGDGEYDQGKVMYGYSSYGDIQRNLHADDISGIRWIYGEAAALTLSGTVRTGSGTGVSGVILSGLPGNPQTGSNGTYSCEVTPGWSGTVTPQKTGYTFSPSSRSYSSVGSSSANQDYTATAFSSDATLADLKVNGVTVSGFLSSRTDYSVELPAGTTTVPTVTATLSDANATKSITQAAALPGAASVTVTAQDGVTRKTYSVSFTIAANHDASLSDLMVYGGTVAGFSGRILVYGYYLPYGTTGVPPVTAVASDPKATVEITPATALPGTSTILVTAEDGVTTETYRINFILDPPSSDATLSDLRVDGTTIAGFDPSVTGYQTTLPHGTTRVPTVGGFVNDADATLVVSPAASLPGTTTVTVTAQDGVTRMAYTVEFRIAPNDDATLSGIRINGSEVPGFQSNTLAYNVILPANENTAPEVTVVLHDPNATAEISLPDEFPGTANIRVIAEDGISTLTYELFISIAANGTGDLAIPSGLSVYPNPNRGDFFVSDPSVTGRTVRIQVIDLTGKILYDNTMESPVAGLNVRIRIPGLHQGACFVRLIDGNHVTCGKIIVE